MRIGDLVRLHTRHKFLVLAHSPVAYAELGRLVAGARRHSIDHIVDRYRTGLTAALAAPPMTGRHVNVLHHAAGHLRGVASHETRREVVASIAGYQKGLVPLDVPVALLAGHAERHGIRYLTDQVYLDAYRQPSSTTSKSPAVSVLNAGFN